MKKRLVSLVAAAALLGSVSIASAGTVTTKGDTNVSIGGFIQTYFTWANNTPGGVMGYTANPKYTKPGVESSSANTNFNTSSQWARISLGLSNPTEGITGVVEGDFFGAGGGGGNDFQEYNKGNFRLRHAYFVKSFCQEGCNYEPWIIIGQTWNPVTHLVSYSLDGILGIAGNNLGEGSFRTSLMGFGVKFDLGSVKLNPAIYAANLSAESNFTNSGVLGKAALTQRLTAPGVVVRLPIEFNTGLGAPATLYLAGEWQSMKVSGEGNTIAGVPYSISDQNENGVLGMASLELPIYFVKLHGQVHYADGMTGYDYPIPGGQWAMPSFYVDKSGGVNKVRTTDWATEAQIDFDKLVQIPFTVAGGYGQAVFSNYGDLTYSSTPLIRKEATLFANVNYNLTKSASIGLEYEHNRTYYIGAGNDSGDARGSNVVFLTGMYKF